MSKDKVSIAYRIGHWFTYHPWLKIIAFILAVVVWIFVNGELLKLNG